ncbi:hypothetical protein ANN_08981 [Periplaneta americana]|uniref:Uncharacterized protein n=1 Tax=Periplaneta americana TaxID=6978 RepID=A0ABQ8TL46_PERAM|nr:hypothetical protein ANN_08981 [Periplaneta americana]
MSPGSSTKSYPAFARIGLRENPGKNHNQITLSQPGFEPGPSGFAARRADRYSTGHRGGNGQLIFFTEAKFDKSRLEKTGTRSNRDSRFQDFEVFRSQIELFNKAMKCKVECQPEELQCDLLFKQQRQLVLIFGNSFQKNVINISETGV